MLRSFRKTRRPSLYRRFETLVDPFAEDGRDTPPDRIWPYIRTHLRPYHRLLPLIGAAGIIVALAETWLTYYGGRLIDLMTEEGILGEHRGSKSREILITLADWEEAHGESFEQAETVE